MLQGYTRAIKRSGVCGSSQLDSPRQEPLGSLNVDVFTLSDGQAIHFPQGYDCRGAVQEREGIGSQNSGVRIVG